MMVQPKILSVLRSRKQREVQGLHPEAAEVEEVQRQRWVEIDRSLTLRHQSRRQAHEPVEKDEVEAARIAKHLLIRTCANIYHLVILLAHLNS